MGKNKTRKVVLNNFLHVFQFGNINLIFLIFMIKRKNKRYLFLLKEKKKRSYFLFHKSIHFKFILRNFKIYLLNLIERIVEIISTKLLLVLFSLLIIILEIIKKTLTINTPLLFPYSNPQQVL